jgi:hypothetical protein
MAPARTPASTDRRRFPRWRRVLAWGVPLALVVALAIGWPVPEPDVDAWRRRVVAEGPHDARSTYWIGHSLVDGVDPHVASPTNVVDKVDRLAASLGLEHRAFRQTSWGAPLSLHVRGRSHAPGREEPSLPARLEELREHGARYDVLLLTDTVPLSSARRWEHTDFHATELACELWRQRPDARVVLHETWVSLQLPPESDDPRGWSFVDQIARERVEVERAAAAISTGAVIEPGPFGRVTRWFRSAAPCRAPSAVTVAPVGSCLARLSEELARDPSWELRITDFFVNPRLGATDPPGRRGQPPTDPPGWGDDAPARFTELPLRHPEEPFDDVHASDLGVYFSALVHFATIFGRDPSGAPSMAEGVDDTTATRLGRFAWSCVRDDPAAGVTR